MERYGITMHKSKVELQRCFISSIDATKDFVDYNEYIMDIEGELCQYIMQLFTHNYDSIAAKKCSFDDDSFLAGILPENAEGFDAFVDVITDEMHTLIGKTVDLQSGSGLFVWALVEEQPVIAFFKLNYQSRFSCVVEDDGSVSWKKTMRLLPTSAQKEYDFFFINIYEKKAWMSDYKCHLDGKVINYMADEILKIELTPSEKEMVSVIETAVLDTIKECYKKEAPQKVFEYRQSLASEVQDYGNISAVNMERTVFADNEEAKEVYREKMEELQIPKKPIEVGKKTQRKLNKKQKIVTENGIEILVPIEYLEDKEVFEYRQEETGSVSIVIKDVKGNLK